MQALKFYGDAKVSWVAVTAIVIVNESCVSHLHTGCYRYKNTSLLLLQLVSCITSIDKFEFIKSSSQCATMNTLIIDNEPQ